MRVSAGAYASFAIGCLGIAATLIVTIVIGPSPYAPYLVGIAIVFAVLSIISFYGAWAAHVGGNRSDGAVGYPQFMRTREQLRQEIAAKSSEITVLKARLDALAPRRLTQNEMTWIADTASDMLHNHIRSLPPAFEKHMAHEKFRIEVVSVGDEVETVNYRNDFASAFESAGFGVITSVWAAGPRQFSELAGSVTLLADDTSPLAFQNGVRPIVAAALNAAQIMFRESDNFPRQRGAHETVPGIVYPAAIIVIGQRSTA